jgi:hypothetical protein
MPSERKRPPPATAKRTHHFCCVNILISARILIAAAPSMPQPHRGIGGMQMPVPNLTTISSSLVCTFPITPFTGKAITDEKPTHRYELLHHELAQALKRILQSPEIKAVDEHGWQQAFGAMSHVPPEEPMRDECGQLDEK